MFPAFDRILALKKSRGGGGVVDADREERIIDDIFTSDDLGPLWHLKFSERELRCLYEMKSSGKSSGMSSGMQNYV